MNNEQEFNITDLVPEFPSQPRKEISRDSLIRWITSEFSPSCTKQVVASGPLSGKTNFLSQFALHHKNKVISYFINSNPLTQDLRTFLFVICNQISRLLGRSNLPENIRLEDLKTIFPGLAINLAELAKKSHSNYYFAIDGLEWGLLGEKGNRIIDYPLSSFPGSPYVLCSCRLGQKDELPLDGFEIREDISHHLEFNFTDTQEYLAELNLEPNIIRMIHEKANGLPGYIKIIKDTILTSDATWVQSNNLPTNVENLIAKQLTIVYQNSAEYISEALQYIAVSPKPLNAVFLASILAVEVKSFLVAILRTGIVFYDKANESLRISSELTRDVIKSKLGDKKEGISATLLERVKNSTIKDDLLTTLLMKDAQDYDGISEKLDNNNIITTFNQTKNINLITRGLHIGSQMAYDARDIRGLINWNLKLKTAKSVLSHSVNFNEISALISVGNFADARQRVYALPDSISKIRLLARTYSAMKEIGERISKSALEELNVLITNQHLEDYDKDTLQVLAMDLFPVLPDRALAILKNKFTQEADTTPIEFALKLDENVDAQNGVKHGGFEDLQFGHFFRSQSSWLKELPLINLIQELEKTQKTTAKEFLIRQWCTQNHKSPELDQGIQLWIDTVVEDNSFSIPLSSLRKVSSILKNVDKGYQEKLVYRLEIPSFNSIRTPWEEWVGFQLNLAEVLYNSNVKSSMKRIEQIYETINLEVYDQDVKVFCYARLWATVSKYYKGIEQNVKLNLERILSNLLQDGALHDEILNRTLQIIAPIDVEYALEKAFEMNMLTRRITAIRAILKASLRKRIDLDISNIIENNISEFDEIDKSFLFLDISQEVWKRYLKLNDANQAVILKHVRKIIDHSQRANALGYLVANWSNEKLIRTEKLIKEAISSWSQEDDLAIKISLGFELVERIAERDKETAKDFLLDVQGLYMLPGGALASGDLSRAYKQIIEFAIRSLNLRAFSTKDGPVDKVMDLIERVPSRRKRIMLYSQLAARAYTEGYPKAAEDVIRKKVLPGIEPVENDFDKYLIIRFCLPIIFRYDKQTAIELSERLPRSFREDGWVFTVIWVLTLGELRTSIDIEHLKVQADYPTIRDYAIEAAKNVLTDHNILYSITSICKVIEQSVKSQKLDVTQAQFLLHSLDELVVQKLPDKNNIHHNGYLITCQSTIHGARSVAYKATSKKGSLSKVDIRKKWDELESASKTIPNVADKVFVMEIVATEMFKNNDLKAITLLEESERLINSVPALIDRSHRLEAIGKAWGVMGKKDLATYTLEKSLELIPQMSGISQDRKLEVLVQAAYNLSPEFADKIVTNYDSRFSKNILNPLRITQEAEKLIQNPEKITKLFKDQETNLLRYILGVCANRHYNDLVFGHGRIPEQNILLEWVYQASQTDETTFFQVTKWVQECIKDQFLSHELTNVFLDLASLILKFTTLVSPAMNEGIPEEIINILPGFSSKVSVFRVGEFEKAKTWLDDWIKKNAQGYVKVVDPYFSPAQLIYFANVPKNCKMIVVTTDKYFKEYSTAERMKAQLEFTWSQFGKGTPPQIHFIIVPESQGELFHDRVIISRDRGLDLGQSLNGIGNKIGKITDLPADDAKELEIKYVDNLLNQNTWFITRDIQPIVVRIGN